MVSSPPSKSSLSALFWQFGPPGNIEHGSLLREARQAVLHKAAHLWYRLDMPLSGYPYKLCGTVDARLSRAQQLAIAREFYETPLCCLEPRFSRKVRDHYPEGPSQML
eukprot:15933214-Heterocapsa_arctica.AAC.1